MTSAAQALAHAVRGGLIGPAETLGGQVSLATIGASNIVHRLDRGPVPVAYVKATGIAAGVDGDDSVARERRVVGLLDGSVAVPAALSLSTATQLWLEPVAGSSLADRDVGLGRVHAVDRAQQRHLRKPDDVGVPRVDRERRVVPGALHRSGTSRRAPSRQPRLRADVADLG